MDLRFYGTNRLRTRPGSGARRRGICRGRLKSQHPENAEDPGNLRRLKNRDTWQQVEPLAGSRRSLPDFVAASCQSVEGTDPAPLHRTVRDRAFTGRGYFAPHAFPALPAQHSIPRPSTATSAPSQDAATGSFSAARFKLRADRPDCLLQS